VLSYRLYISPGAEALARRGLPREAIERAADDLAVVLLARVGGELFSGSGVGVQANLAGGETVDVILLRDAAREPDGTRIPGYVLQVCTSDEAAGLRTRYGASMSRVWGHA
jgi:hypothetical protein